MTPILGQTKLSPSGPPGPKSNKNSWLGLGNNFYIWQKWKVAKGYVLVSIVGQNGGGGVDSFE